MIEKSELPINAIDFDTIKEGINKNKIADEKILKSKK